MGATGIFYPYLQSAGKWDELRYSLRSLERNFKEEDYQVWIVGDLPEWIKGVHHIVHEKLERTGGSTTYDAVSKLKAYVEHKATPERFVRMYDDVYFIGERSMADLEVTRYLFTWEELQRGLFTSGGAIWREQVMRSAEEVRLAGYDGIMTETHCPEVFEKEKMAEILDRFDPLGSRLMTSTLYYNVFPFERMLCDRKVERALYYGYENEFSHGASSDGLNQQMAGKNFLNHNDEGLDEELIGFIEGMFPDKSRWER